MSKKKKPPLPASANQTVHHKALLDLPSSYLRGIGKIIMANALLENHVSELIFTLLKLTPNEGRVAFEYRGASTMFTLARRLLELHGITPKIDVIDLEECIRDCCQARDQIAHGVWYKKDDVIRLRLTAGSYETPEGKRSRAITPEGKIIPPDYWEHTQMTILQNAQVVLRLRKEVQETLRSRAIAE
jgi:hypothetical protein